MWLANEYISLYYNNAVDEAIINETSFSNFKSNPNYNSVVGMSELWQADIWYENIKLNHKDLYDRLKTFCLNDKYGSPQIWESKDGIKISPNTLRFINTLLEIETTFNLKNNSIKIAELGIGYGGLCYILNSYYNVKSYTLIDLPNVYDLANKYLKLLDVNTQTKEFFEDTDLFVSEWCLSEFDDADIVNFYNKYIIKSKNVYLQMNLHEEDRKTKFLNLLSTDFDYTVKDEFPKTQWPNYVVFAKNKRIT